MSLQHILTALCLIAIAHGGKLKRDVAEHAKSIADLNESLEQLKVQIENSVQETEQSVSQMNENLEKRISESSSQLQAQLEASNSQSESLLSQLKAQLEAQFLSQMREELEKRMAESSKELQAEIEASISQCGTSLSQLKAQLEARLASSASSLSRLQTELNQKVSRPVSVSCQTRYTGMNNDGGGDSVYLDRHHVNCGQAFLTYLHLERNSGHNQIQYRYECCTIR